MTRTMQDIVFKVITSISYSILSMYILKTTYICYSLIKKVEDNNYYDDDDIPGVTVEVEVDLEYLRSVLESVPNCKGQSKGTYLASVSIHTRNICAVELAVPVLHSFTP